MFDLKQILTSLVVSIVVVVGYGLVGGNDQSLGVTGTRFLTVSVLTIPHP